MMLPMKMNLVEHPPLSLLESCKSIKQALQIHAQIILTGLHHQIFTVSRLVSFFALAGTIESLKHSRILFSQVNRPNSFIYNTVMRGYSHSDSPQEALVIYTGMLRERTDLPNKFTFPFLLNSSARLSTIEPGLQVHGHVLKLGFESDIFIRNALIHLYSVFRHIDSARNIFGESHVRDLVSYNTMINAYVRADQPRFALCLFREMQSHNIQPDEFTFVPLMCASSVLNDQKIGKKIHNLIYKSRYRLDSNILLKNAVLDMYAKCGLMSIAERVFRSITSASTAAWSSMVSGYAKCGEIEIARQMFDKMDERDIVSWTAMISGYSQAGQHSEALELFVQMENLGIRPDEVTMVSVLSACARLGALTFGQRIHQRYIKNHLLAQNTILASAVLDMYAKCGNIDTALQIFRGILDGKKTVTLFNSMISGLAQHGHGKISIAVFEEMELTGVKPDEVTFVAVLTACSHSGLVHKGKELFESISNVYGIKPRIEHYGCMVDLLARDGQLYEAHNLIRSMPFPANPVIWIALLGACKMHGNTELGKLAGEKLLELEPDHGARYVLLSNMFANANQWEEAGRVRKVMENKGIKKPPGWSYIELNGTINRFLASNKSNPQSEDIESMLRDMTIKLKSAGYVPNTSQVTYDIEDEEKEKVVLHHSEKLALAFGLINTKHQDTIRIIKNLRICGDCHSAFKLLSEIYTREIVVRDAIRFHHFKNGICSCKDFW